jgi:molecular chaperone DnaJ
MDINKNYYAILGLDKNSDFKVIKKKYYQLSFKYHPDTNREVDTNIFKEIKEAYEVLSKVDIRLKYDSKSKYGKDYNEYSELFNIDVDINFNTFTKNVDDFIKNEVNNINIEVGDSFDGKLEYHRWIMCKTCEGSGKDLSSKIIIKDTNGKIIKKFDADNGCDFCEGSGKFENGNICNFCGGVGKVGINPCKKCNGEKRILGKQKINKIKLTGDVTKIDAMGHYAKGGNIGYLTITKKKN